MSIYPPPTTPPAPPAPKRNRWSIALPALVLATVGVGLGVIHLTKYASTPNESTPTLSGTGEYDAAPEMMSDSEQESLALELWYDTDYCFTDCTRAYEPWEWIRNAEGYGLYHSYDVRSMDEYLHTESTQNLDDLCVEFWDASDDEVARTARESDVAPGAFVLTLYIWCDS